MAEHTFFPRGRWLGLFGIVSVLLAVLLTLRSISDQRLQDPVCQGLAGAGFPLTVICDGVGSSPTGSWGKIDEADLIFPNLFFLGDVLFYTVLLWLPWLLALGISHRVRRRNGTT
jgi:hypothetical protein